MIAQLKMKIDLGKINLLDLKLLQLASAMVTIILVKCFPVLQSLDILWYALLGALIAIRPVYKLLKS